MSFDYSSQSLIGFDEIRPDRGKYHKIFRSGGNDLHKLVTSPGPIHFLSPSGQGENPSIEEYEDIEINIQISGNTYLTDKNIFSVGFRADNSSNKFIGIRRGEGYQYEMTPTYLRVNDNEISIPEVFNSSNFDTTVAEHYLTSSVAFVTEVNEYTVVTAVKSDSWVYSFKFVQELIFDDYYVLNNPYISGVYTTYQVDANDRFHIMCNDGEGYTLSIDKPKIWTSSSTFGEGVNHTLYESGGKFFYTKEINQDGVDWALENTPPFYLDLNILYSGETNDGYVDNSINTQPNPWQDCHDSSSGNAYNDTNSSASGGGPYVQHTYNSKTGDEYVAMRRSFLPFSTSALPDDATIISGIVTIQGYSDNDTGGFLTSSNVEFPINTSSFGFVVFSGESISPDGSYASCMSWSTGNNEFVLNASGLAYIKLQSVTSFALLEISDFYDDDPGYDNTINNGMYYSNGGNKPYLEITYTVPFKAELYLQPGNYDTELYLTGSSWSI